jgi:hypothetical protein
MQRYKFKKLFKVIAFTDFDGGKLALEIAEFNEYPNEEQLSECLEKYLDDNEDIVYANVTLKIDLQHVPELIR